MAPEQLGRAAERGQALHHALVGVPAPQVECGEDARAGALELVVRRVQHLERLAEQLVALGAEHLQGLPVDVHHQPVAREHQPDRRQLEGGAVIQRQVHTGGRYSSA